MKYEIKYGRFGAYFYDNELKKDLDLNTILIKLRKLDVMEKVNKGVFILCNTCESNPDNCTQAKYNLEKPLIEFDYCSSYKPKK